MLKSETRTIDGLEVTTTQLPVLRAFALFTKLGKVLAPALARAADLQLDPDMDVSALAPALGELFAQLDPADATQLAHDVLISTSVVADGRITELSQSGAIDLVFGGRFLAFLKTMAFAIEVNFRDFFDGTLGSATLPGNKKGSD